ncbi:hypothetical protein [Actinopolyspora halophila]|uniref:hypothetical protein n=1 Tax=Actinopolyspora halophila TaxID=1850 RepID=UPI000378A6E4|nr:hypothetical protein [Actinopolyspora halophila]
MATPTTNGPRRRSGPSAPISVITGTVFALCVVAGATMLELDLPYGEGSATWKPVFKALIVVTWVSDVLFLISLFFARKHRTRPRTRLTAAVRATGRTVLVVLGAAFLITTPLNLLAS